MSDTEFGKSQLEVIQELTKTFIALGIWSTKPQYMSKFVQIFNIKTNEYERIDLEAGVVIGSRKEKYICPELQLPY